MREINQPLPLHLITGLLGSGKTTLLQNLLKQKPKHERWGIIINDFGTIGIDANLLTTANELIEVRNGCLCCSAQIGFQQALQALRKQSLDRIFIEPTGIGHPDQIIHTLQLFPGLKLASVTAVLTPLQLTPERWQKSSLLRAIASLADTIILNKTDLSDKQSQKQARKLLETLSRPPLHIIETVQAQVNAAQILQPEKQKSPLLWQDEPHQTCISRPHQSDLPGLQQVELAESDDLVSIGYVFSPKVVFSRPALRELFAQSTIGRAKGLLRMGKHWQLLQFADGQLKLETFAWHQDSRLLIFLRQAQRQQLKAFEQALKACLTIKEI